MNPALPLVTLGRSELRVTPICLGTMTFGEQVDERAAHAILDCALEQGVNFIDTAEVYSVPTRRETYGASNWRVASTIIGVTTLAQLDENLAAWGVRLPRDVLDSIDAIRWTHRDPAQ